MIYVENPKYPKCPDCRSNRVYQYQDEYSTVFKCNSCGLLFDSGMLKEFKEFKDIV